MATFFTMIYHQIFTADTQWFFHITTNGASVYIVLDAQFVYSQSVL